MFRLGEKFRHCPTQNFRQYCITKQKESQQLFVSKETACGIRDDLTVNCKLQFRWSYEICDWYNGTSFKISLTLTSIYIYIYIYIYTHIVA
jgi:hypothetical protein